MKHPPQESNIVPGGKAGAVVIAAIASIVIGALVAWGIGSCQSRSLGLVWRPTRPAVPAEINAMETTPFTSEAQGLEMHRLAEKRLSEYGWVDKEARLVHVPIEVAIELYLARQPVRGARR